MLSVTYIVMLNLNVRNEQKIIDWITLVELFSLVYAGS